MKFMPCFRFVFIFFTMVFSDVNETKHFVTASNIFTTPRERHITC